MLHENGAVDFASIFNFWLGAPLTLNLQVSVVLSVLPKGRSQLANGKDLPTVRWPGVPEGLLNMQLQDISQPTVSRVLKEQYGMCLSLTLWRCKRSGHRKVKEYNSSKLPETGAHEQPSGTTGYTE